MKVYGTCKSCKNEISYSTSAGTRVEFAMQEWEKKSLPCSACGESSEFHVDDMFTKESKIAQIGAGLILLIGTPILIFVVNPIFTSTQNHYAIYVFGGFLLTPIIAYAIIKKQDQVRVNTFNRAKLKGRIHNI